TLGSVLVAYLSLIFYRGWSLENSLCGVSVF
ncbi:MAG: hypothetical protein ACI82E_000365, partial [Nonlabens sp.]